VLCHEAEQCIRAAVLPCCVQKKGLGWNGVAAFPSSALLQKGEELTTGLLPRSALRQSPEKYYFELPAVDA